MGILAEAEKIRRKYFHPFKKELRTSRTRGKVFHDELRAHQTKFNNQVEYGIQKCSQKAQRAETDPGQIFHAFDLELAQLLKQARAQMVAIRLEQSELDAHIDTALSCEQKLQHLQGDSAIN